MTTNNCNQNPIMGRPFRDFIYGMTDYDIVINEARQAELAGNTCDIERLQANANAIIETLLLGLQSVGTLLADSVTNPETTINQTDLANTGELISLLAECAFSIHEITLQTHRELYRRKK